MAESRTSGDSTLVVLVVEPDGGARQSLTEHLRGAGLPVRAFDSAEDLLAEQRSPLWGCLITEVRLPGLSGIELLDELRANGEHLPVIFTSGGDDVPTAVKALRRGAVDFFEKPVVPRVLLARVRQCLEQQSAESTSARRRAPRSLGASDRTD